MARKNAAFTYCFAIKEQFPAAKTRTDYSAIKNTLGVINEAAERLSDAFAEWARIHLQISYLYLIRHIHSSDYYVGAILSRW